MPTYLEILQQVIGKDSQTSVSPVMRWLNPTLMGIQGNGLTYKYLIRKEMTNPFGNLHGGISALIIDDAIGATSMAFNPDYICLTVNNIIDYKGSANEGETIIAETVILDNEHRIISVQCEIWNADKSKLIAKGISRLLKKHK
jgi:acyl-coenzyme A thioesterase 13